jgi:NTP pyrophosphatase (non-canonical NTP hydrolase)
LPDSSGDEGKAATSEGAADDPTVAALHAIARALPDRINADPEHVEQGLARLVLTVIELLREVLEHQAIRRMDGGTLTEEEIERLGMALLKLNHRMGELKTTFGLTDADLNIDLGPLGRLR